MAIENSRDNLTKNTQLMTIQTTKAIVTNVCTILIVNKKVLDSIESYYQETGSYIDDISIMTEIIGSDWGYSFEEYLDTEFISKVGDDTKSALLEAKERLTEDSDDEYRVICLETDFDLVWKAEDDNRYEVAWRYLNHCIWLVNTLYNKYLEKLSDSRDKFYN